MKEKLKILELFGGIGACSKALERLNIEHEVVDYVEIDKYAVKSYNAIHETNFEPQDITKWDKDIKVDLIMHGSPCQDFSLAGKQAGGDKDSGTRSSLLYETVRIVSNLKPKYVIWENVKNVLSQKHRHNFDNYLSEMEELGYTNYYQVLNAKDYGIPQNRERVFTVSILNGNNYEFPKIQELKTIPLNYIEENADEKYNLTEKNIKCYQREFGSKGKELDLFKPIPTLTSAMGTGGGNVPYFTFPPKQELKLRLKDMLEDEVDEKYYLDKYLDKLVVKDKISENDIKIEATIEQKGWHRLMKDVLSKESICTCLNTMQGGNLEPKVLIKEATKQGYKEAYDGDSVNLAYPESETRRGRVGEQISQTLQCNDNMGVVESYVSKKYSEFKKEKGYIPELFNPYNQKEITDIAPTQSTQCGSTTSSATVLLKSDLRIRKLSTLECWRLMGFDDSDFEKASQVCSNSQLYKQAGNSIVVNVLEEIFKELFKEDQQ